MQTLRTVVGAVHRPSLTQHPCYRQSEIGNPERDSIYTALRPTRVCNSITKYENNPQVSYIMSWVNITQTSLYQSTGHTWQDKLQMTDKTDAAWPRKWKQSQYKFRKEAGSNLDLATECSTVFLCFPQNLKKNSFQILDYCQSGARFKAGNLVARILGS
jgi:hypothetical protein